MPDFELHLTILYQRLGESGLVCQAAAFPEFSFFGVAEGVAERMVFDHARALVESGDTRDLYQRHPLGELTTGEVTVTIDPPRRSAIWREPVPLTFPTLIRRHPDGPRIGAVPALQIAALASTDKELTERLQREVIFALQRTKASKSLDALAHLQRVEAVQLRDSTLAVQLRSPRQAAQEGAREEQKKPILEEVGTDLAQQAGAGILPHAYEIDATLDAIFESLTAPAPRSILLVGPAGVGKTATVYELVRRRHALGLGAAPFWATSGARLIAGALGFGVWQERCTTLIREASAAHTILYLGNLVELTEVGKSNVDATGIASFLRPAIARGQLLALAECTPEQATLLERTDPQLLAAFRIIKIDEPPPQRVAVVLSKVAAEFPSGVRPEALAEVERLHRRYGTYSPFPGRAVRFLRNLLAQRQQTSTAAALHLAIKANDLRHWLKHPSDFPPLHERDVIAAFAAQTGLPRFMLDDEVPLDLPDTRARFSAQLIGQAGAVDRVVDLLV